MHPDKKITMEDTWKSADLRRHIRDGGCEEERVRRRDEIERRHRAGESVERRLRDPEKEARRERDRHRERDGTRERGKQRDEEQDRHLDRRKEGSRDRRDEREERDREKRREREREVDRSKHGREHRDRKRDGEEKENQDKERDKERDRDGERERARERDRGEDRDRRRDERDREIRREERDREHRAERDRKRNEKSGEGGRKGDRKHDREHRDRHGEQERQKESERHKDESRDKRRDKERRARQEDRKHPEQREEREYKEERRKDKDERERRHKERSQHDEKRMHNSEPREQRDRKGSEGHHRGDRERAEQDKHRERRRKEEADPERNRIDRTSSTKESAPDQGHGDSTETSKTKEVAILSEPQTASLSALGDTEEIVGHGEELTEERDHGDQDYEEDFEDYEEDFEEVDESEDEDGNKSHSPEVREEREKLTPQRRNEIEAIQRAIDEENERVGSVQTRQSISTEEDDRPKWSRGSEKTQTRDSQHGRFIDFVAAKHREVSKKVSNKQKKRSADLLRLIDLDFSLTFSLLDLPPVSEYDMYIKSFGSSNTKQAYVQCNEDNVDQNIQTEEVEMFEKWTQHPAERNGACGDASLSREAQDENMNEMNINTQRLTAFLRSASQVMAVLLEEDQAEKRSLQKMQTQPDTLSFSDGSLQLNTKLAFLIGRRISLVHFSQVQRQTMLSVHSPTAKPSTASRLDSNTIICIWNIWEPSRPQKILVYESEVCCCCFSPGKATLVFAGTSVGSVVLWDLREHASIHHSLKIGDDEWTLRHPTFSTDAVLAVSSHLSPVSSMEVVPATVAGGLRPELPLLASEEESSGLSFQLASLDENGVLNLWVVVELPQANVAGSQTDLGLRPGGKVKLLHSSSLRTAERTTQRDAMKTGPLQTLVLKFLPSDSSHFFIGTNMGLVNHGTSHGLKAPPKFYRSQVVAVRPVDVSSIHFSPFGQHLFLVGCGDGSIRLHAVSNEQPVAEWTSSTAGEPVVSVQWAQTRPTVFCVLDAASHLHIWDLLKNDSKPVITERIDVDRVRAMAVFGDSGQHNSYSGIALAHESGKIEVQYFTRIFTVPGAAEEEKLESMVNEAF